ncbi:MAG: aldo/keto reductase [Pseudomonadota bacterium]
MDKSRRAALRVIGGLGALLAARAGYGQDRKLMSRKIPSTGEELPAIGLGTWQVFDAGARAAALAPLREVLKAFAAAGAKLIDTSPMYGSAESVAGDLIAALGLRDKLFIATKVWTSGRENGVAQIETSFRRLRVETMDLMQVHNLMDIATHTKTLKEMKSKGRVRYVGITHYTSSAYAEVEKWLKTGQYDFLQINYSLAERESENRLLGLCKERNIAVIANRPFAEGAMFQRVRGKPLPAWAAELGIASWAQFFLKWIVAHPAVTCAIPGTGKPEYMTDNLAAGYGAMPDEATRKRMAEYYDQL